MGIYDKELSNWAFEKGFLADSACWYGLTESNYNQYLSDYDYYKVWPLNTWTRIWINDKLTLKYVLSQNGFSELLPDYYYYTSPDGHLCPLDECPIKKRIHFLSDFIKTLKIVGVMACKPCNGTSSLGFFRISVSDGQMMINNEKVTDDGLANFIQSHPNYLFTEYLYPAGYFKKLNEKIHTLRLVLINPLNRDPKIIGGYLRIPNGNVGEANYLHLEDNQFFNYNIVADIDPDTGAWGNTKAIYMDKFEELPIMPNSKLNLSGFIENFESLKNVIYLMATKFRLLEYWGFDLCISTKGFKLMEINTHPGIRHMQIFKSFLADEYTKNYFLEKLERISRMNKEERLARNCIIR